MMTETSIHIGMDDIDSPRGGCTTHFASLLVEKLTERKVSWIDYPNLIRLNPNVPFRTRGNGAVALRFKVSEIDSRELLDLIMTQVWNYVQGDYPNTNPGVVLVTGSIPEQVVELSRRAMWRALPIELAERLLEKLEVPHIAFGNSRGLIGALSAIGNQLINDHTYEFIAYRSIEEGHGKRGVDPSSVLEMDKQFGDVLFSNIDPDDGRILIEPHGPDPVIYGIRGEKPDILIEASKLVSSKQSIDRWMLFRTNQGTAQHLENSVRVSNLRPYMAARVEGLVDSTPKAIEGGHVLFSLRDYTGPVSCAAYEPTGKFRDIVLMLREGDKISVGAGVRPASRTHSMTLNIEELIVLELNLVELKNPKCQMCGKRMKSAGVEKGFKCSKCGFKDSKAKKVSERIERILRPGIFLPSYSAQRHLTRPKERFNKVNNGIPLDLINKWHSP